jgi:hypothetical protein
MEHKLELSRFTVTSDQDNPHQHTLVDHRVRSEYVEDNWLPFIGPVALILARRLDARLGYEQRVAVETARWCEGLGVEPVDLLTAVNRLVRYGLAEWGDGQNLLRLHRFWPAVPPAIATPPHKAALAALNGEMM